MYEIEDVNYFVGKGGKLFEYDYYLDICFETEGVAYTTSGFVATFDEDEVYNIAVEPDRTYWEDAPCTDNDDEYKA